LDIPVIRLRTTLSFIIILLLAAVPVFSQDSLVVLAKKQIKAPVSDYILKLDTLIHLETGFKRRITTYRLFYPNNFKLYLSPNVTNTFTYGGSYRFIDAGGSFSTRLFNGGQNGNKKGKTTENTFGAGFALKKFYLRGDISSTKGFYLENSAELGIAKPDTPYYLFPGFTASQLSLQLRYNPNPRFSLSALNSGTEVQLKSAWSVIPVFHTALFLFEDKEDLNLGVENESTSSLDLNLIVPFAATWAVSRRVYFSGAAGPSIGVDIFKSVSYNISRVLERTKGTSLSTGYVVQGSAGYNGDHLYAGLDTYFRNYGHRIENLDRMNKRYFSFNFYIGWRLKAPRWTKKTVDWINKTSPIKFE